MPVRIFMVPPLFAARDLPIYPSTPKANTRLPGEKNQMTACFDLVKTNTAAYYCIRNSEQYLHQKY